MSNFVKAAKKQDIEAGSGVVSDIQGQSIAIFNVEGKFYATQNTCPHQGGPLGEGELQDNIVTCPWHAWQFDVVTGSNEENPNLKIRCFPVQIEGDDILVDLGQTQ